MLSRLDDIYRYMKTMLYALLVALMIGVSGCATDAAVGVGVVIETPAPIVYYGWYGSYYGYYYWNGPSIVYGCPPWGWHGWHGHYYHRPPVYHRPAPPPIHHGSPPSAVVPHRQVVPRPPVIAPQPRGPSPRQMPPQNAPRPSKPGVSRQGR